LSIDFLISCVNYKEGHVSKILDTIEVFHSVVEQEAQEGQLDVFKELELEYPPSVKVLWIFDS
jgi:hypothetical protein